jgi:hypothetical protein
VFNGGDPTGDFTNITWDSWGGPTADGHGTAEWVGQTQVVAAGTLEPAQFRAYDLGTCQGQSVYLHLAVWFPQHGQNFDPSSNGEANYTLCPSGPTGAPVTATTTAPVESTIRVYASCVMPVAEQTPTMKPTEIDMACADNGFGIKDLQWTSWTVGSATGSGTTWYRDCHPNCAVGETIYTPNVHVTLTNPVRGANGAVVWSQISFSELPPGYAAGTQPLPTRPI